MRKYKKFLAVLAVLAVAVCGAIGLCVSSTYSPRQPMAGECYAPKYKLAAQASMDRWIAAHWPALDVPKTNDAAYMQLTLSPIVANLQIIRAEAALLDVPDCAERAHRLLLSSYDTELDAYAAYMQGNVHKGDRLYRQAGQTGLEWSEALQDLSPSRGSWYKP